MRRILYEAGVQATSEDITDRVRLYTLDLAQNAEEGAVATSSMVIDDPDGDYDVVGWRRVRVYEDAASGSNTLMYNGWVAGRDIKRGPFVVAGGRIWDCSMVDMNAVIEMRVMNGSNANRPAETDVARINWLMGTNEMNRITETEYISSASPKNMDAVDYRGQRLVDIIDDCAQQSGKNYFVYTKDNGVGNSLTLGLWYDFATSTAYSSPLRLSNDLDDVDGVWTFAPAMDSVLTRDPGRTYSGAYVRYDGGSVYEESITTSNLYTRRDAVYDASNVKNATTATNRALRYLGTTDVEEDRITTSFWVPAAKVNFVREGMRIQFKATHLPGYTSFTWVRALQRKILEVSEQEDPSYLVSLELSSQPGAPPTDVGAAALYLGQDNSYLDENLDPAPVIYVNGTAFTVPDTHDAGSLNDLLTIPDGILTPGSNVIAVAIENGIEPIGWSFGNATGLVLRVYNGPNDSSPILAHTSTDNKTWLVENSAGTIDGLPANWETAGFDDSGWSSAIDVTDIDYFFSSSLGDLNPPTAPARWVAPPGVTAGTFDRGLIWLIRIHFIV